MSYVVRQRRNHELERLIKFAVAQKMHPIIIVI